MLTCQKRSKGKGGGKGQSQSGTKRGKNKGKNTDDHDDEPDGSVPAERRKGDSELAQLDLKRQQLKLQSVAAPWPLGLTYACS